jgi:putative CocE/NonD family hydrolase
MKRSLRWRPWLLCALAFLTVCLVGAKSLPQDQKKDETKPAEVIPAKVSGYSDSGTFHLYKDEEILVRINFTWKEDGSFENKSVMELAGQKLETDTNIRADKDGHWTTIEGTARFIGKFKVEREANKAKVTLAKKSETVPLKTGMVLYEDMAPALISMSVRTYDQAKGGKQTFPLGIIPVAVIDATLERKDNVERSVGGKDLKLTRYTLTIANIDIIVWSDSDAKIYLLEVPSQSVAYVREGYESLRKAAVEDTSVSRPDFNVKVDANTRVPMRDGVKLGTDIYRPDKPGKYPGILIRTPYKKDMSELTGKYYARRGYVVAIQDVRGRFSSEGVWEPFVNEPKDGYDSVEWLAAQPWCDGKIGMIGGSYVGWVQWWAASQKPPHLVTIIPNVSPPEPFYNFPYEYGTFFLWAAIWWSEVVETAATADLSGAKLNEVMGKKYHKQLMKLPVIELDKEILGKESPYWRKWIEHPTDDAYWQQAGYYQHLDKIDIPVFHQSGWFDGDGIGSKLNYAKMAALGRANQKLTLGPWGHTDVATRTLGKRDFGPQALRDLPRDYLRWFDFWLKGKDNGVPKEPLVSLFVMNSNKWIHGPKYPLPQTRSEKWYLTSSGSANTSLGDGKLTREMPTKDAPADRYSYNPGDPTPNPDFLEEEDKEAENKEKKSLPDKEKKAAEDDKDKKAPAKDRREETTKTRRDILVYVSEPFAEEYTFAGPVSAVLYASTSAKDTDWFMRLMTVDEKGKLFVLVHGNIRARFRESMAKPTLLEPNKVYEYTLDLWQTGISVPKGHRLRVEVASASFPLFSRNLNTGGHNERETEFVTAEQTIYHNAQYPSHVILPVIPDEGGDKVKAKGK